MDGRADHRAEHGVQLLGVDASGEQRRDALFAAEHVVQGKACRVLVLQVRQFLKEHDVHGRLVRVDQVEARVLVCGKHRAGDGHDRGDARARGDRHEVVLVFRVDGFRVVHPGHLVLGNEGTGRAHHVDDVALGQRFVGPGGEDSAEVALDRNADFTAHRGRADRVAAAQLEGVALGVRQFLAQRNVLAGNVVELVGQVLGYLEGDLDGVGGQPAHLGDAQGMEGGPASGRFGRGSGICHESTLK